MSIGSSLRNFWQWMRARPIRVACILVPVAAAGLVWSTIYVRSFAHVKKEYQPSDIWVVDRANYPLEPIRTHDKKRSLQWTGWNEVSPAFQKLLVQVEDHRFYAHHGVDALAVSKALWNGVTGKPWRGASTLSMQLVGLLNGDTLLTRRNVPQKLQQMMAALKLESRWTKDEILETYINLVPFRGELVGLRAASVGYFKKNPAGLVEDEAALLIALLRSPNAPVERVAQRACLILQKMDCPELQNLAQQVLSKPYRLARTRTLVPVISNHFIEGAQTHHTIHSSLDYSIQDLAMRSLREQLRALHDQNVNDGAALVLETQTGRVVAYAANAGAGVASAEQIDGIQTRRQAGSTIKPFVYATAFDMRLLTPRSLLSDSPADITVAQGRVYHPRNYDQTFRGLVSAGEALGSSMNVPTVKALQLVGGTEVLERLRSLGFTALQDDDYYGPSLALGAIDVTLWELTQGYRKLALQESPFSDQTRSAIFNTLAAPEYRRFTFGMDSVLTLPFPAAVKTGTSKDMRDNWCIGWTPQYTVGVWVGNFNGKPMWNVSGMSGAAPIWRDLMLALHPHSETTSTQYEAPAEPLPLHTISRIRYPAPDMLVGLDPDIPQRLQKLPIEIENPQKGAQLFLNDRLLNRAQETTLWPLQRGKFRVELKSAAGQLLDAVRFEVR